MKDSASGLITFENRLCEYFCSQAVSTEVTDLLTNKEIKVLEKGLDFAPINVKSMSQNWQVISISFVGECA